MLQKGRVWRAGRGFKPFLGEHGSGRKERYNLESGMGAGPLYGDNMEQNTQKLPHPHDKTVLGIVICN